MEFEELELALVLVLLLLDNVEEAGFGGGEVG